jgi:diaminohydroxyphosphoribosylaminopyrimidine deaminase/5-amino-6-(5-phosphoribosylamino)uracil reductase
MPHEKFMRRCLELAKKGLGNVSPNPMVGAVVVHDGIIIGEGYHQQYGQAHAEVNAINSVKDKTLLPESTLYVNLEPCSHYGKTPPCADLIITQNIKHVVIGAIDTHSKVAGKGIEKLRNAGIIITYPILEKACRLLNKRFYCFHEKKRPYVSLKWAQTNNGFISPNSDYNNFPFWITNAKTKILTHTWRAQEDAILIGRKTAELDNPSLDCRAVKGNNPTRILIDPELKSAYTKNTLNKESKLLILNTIKNTEEFYSSAILLDKLTPNTILQHLFEQDITSVIIEGGTHTLQQFIDANLWDEAKILVGKNELTTGLKAPILPASNFTKTTFGEDQIYTHNPI